MFKIRAGGKTIQVGQEELISRLSEFSGSVSVILERESGIQAVSYVDVELGVIRQTYGKRALLKAADFMENGNAFR
ncbi:hypothetical protein [Rheinheimera sp.]|uniref:hypothetical protein n=1 Tax=Rheinheimera sp. TaxID=1869214 RepID=UPI004047BC0E